MNKAYIASSLKNTKNNQKLFQKLSQSGIDAFLPETIENESHYNLPSMYKISDICYKEIESCNFIIAICPFGKSVSAELGYAIYCKRRGDKKSIITLFMDFEDEAMIFPYVEKNFEDIDELVKYISDNKNRGQ